MNLIWHPAFVRVTTRDVTLITSESNSFLVWPTDHPCVQFKARENPTVSAFEFPEWAFIHKLAIEQSVIACTSMVINAHPQLESRWRVDMEWNEFRQR